MNEHLYKITFTTGEVEKVFAGCEARARILAQARQIDKGNSYNVLSVEHLGEF